MQNVKAIGFDLFDTLITVEGLGLQEAMGRLVHLLQRQGFAVEPETFLPIYRDAAKRCRDAVQKAGRETHNRFWISAALCDLGWSVAPDDARVAAAVDAYFSAFLEHAVLLPGTHEALSTLKRHYRLGLLSNFTHGPAVRAILTRLGLMPLLDVVLISGEIGYRKPHQRVFRELERQFGLPRAQIAFVGDDLEADIQGAQAAGLRPIWTTCARMRKAIPASDIPAASPEAEFTMTSWSDLLTRLEVT